MSKTVDSKVVEMRFDNAKFEKNVSTSMSTLDKLKQKLNFNGAAKGFNSLNAAAKSVNITPLANSIDTVKSKFSAMEVMGVTALANITNSAVNAGKNIVSALTIDPIKTGLQEYETQIGATQTILANTSHQGTTLKDVNKALNELNKYADLTIYNFTEMTKNIGTFTAAGLDLDTSVKGIQGIANLAAVSGSTSQQASTAMYQLSQALAAGTVNLQDWNSVVNAGMGGKVFQDAIMQTAKDIKGTDAAVASAIKKYESGSNFRSILNAQDNEAWFSSDILTAALSKFTKTGAVEYLSDLYKVSDDSIKKLQDLGDKTGYNTKEFDKMAQSLSKGDKAMADNIKNVLSMANTATNAATEVKTLSQLWDTLKETAQSGWTRTWELIIGDFDQSKKLFTGLYNFFSGIIEKISDARNKLIGGAMANPFSSMLDKIKSSNIGKTVDKVNNLSKSLEYYQKVVTDVWRGDYKNQPYRYDLLDKAGHNHKVIQDLVNKGYQYKITMKDVEESEKKFGVSLSDTSKSAKKTSESIKTLTDKQLKNAGLTKEEIKLYRELEEQSKKTGKSIDEIVKEMKNQDGRTLLIESFKNAGKGLISVITAIKDAWFEVFPPMTVMQLYNIIKGLNDFSKKLKVSKDTADKLKRTMKGLFAILDIVLTIVGGPIKIAFKALSKILGMFDLNILDVTARVGDAIVGFRDWIDKTLDLTGIFKTLLPYIKDAGKAIKKWFDSLKDSEALKNLKDYLSGVTESFKKWIEGFKGAENIPQYIISGLVNGLKSGATAIFNAVVEFGKLIINTIKSVLGIHSPSVVFIAIGAMIVAGLIIGLTQGFPQVFDKIKEYGGDTMSKFVEGIQNGSSKVFEVIKNFGIKVIEFIKNIDFGAVLTMVFAGGLTFAVVKIAKALESFGSIAESLGGMFSNIGIGVNNLLTNIGASFKAKALETKSKAILNFALAIGILAASIYVLAKIDTKSLWTAVGVIAALAVIIGGLAFAVSKFTATDSVQIAGFALVIFALGSALIKMAIIMKLLSTMSWDELGVATAALTALGLFITGLLNVTKLAGKDVAKIGTMLIGLSAALLLLIVAIKLISLLSPSDIAKGVVVIGLFGGFIVGMVAATKLAGKEIDKVGSMILKISAAMLLLVVTIKLISSLDGSAIVKGLTVITAFGAIIVALVYATQLASGNMSKIGSTILGIAAAMVLMAITMRLIAGMDAGAIAKGLIVITGFAAIIAGLIYATQYAGGNLKGVAVTILAIAVAIGILAAVSIVLSMVKIENLAKGLIAIGLLSAMVVAMIKATRGANDVMKNLIVMTVAIALMAGAIAALSFIEPAKLATATVALSAVMGMFALLIASTKSLGSLKSIIGPMLLMVGVVAALAGVIYALSVLNPSSALGATASLSMLLIAMSGALAILSYISKSFKVTDMLLGVVGLTLMAVPLLAFVDVLATMQGIQNATTNALLLTTMATVLTLLLIPLSVVGALVGASRGIILLGIAALALMAVPLLAFVDVLATMQGIQNATTNAFALIALTNAIADVLVKVSLVAPLAILGVTALSALTGLMLGIGALAMAIGALMEKFPALEGFIDKGLPILSKLAYGVGDIVGSLMAGFSAGLLSGLPDIGMYLSKFMSNMTPFIIGASLVDESVLKGIGILSAAIIALTVADLIAGITSFMSFGSSFADLGTELSKFMINATPFIVGAKMFDASMTEGVKALAETILILTAADVLTGLTSFLHIGSGDPLSNFGTQIGKLGTSLTIFSGSLAGLDETSLSKVDLAAKAIKTLAEAADKIPNSGGWAGKIFGEGSLASFGTELEGTGTALKNFISNIGTFGDTEYATINYAAKAINKFANAADEIPNSGGWVSKLFGEESLGSFSTQIAKTGTALSTFVTNIGTFGEEQLSTVDFAAKAITKLGEAAKATESGFWEKLLGQNSLANFSSKLPDLGTNIADFATNAGKVGADAVSKAVSSLNSVTNLAKLDLGATNTSLETFGTTIVTFSSKVSEFSSNMASVDGESITNAITKIKELLTFTKSIGRTGSKSLSSFGDSLKKVATDGIDKFVSAFNSESSISSVKNAATGLMDKLISGMDSKKDSLVKSGNDAASKIISAIKSDSNHSSMNSAGQYLGSGLVQGINAKKTDAYNAGYALGQAAVKGEKDGQASKSPSKLTIKAGKWLGQGLVIGMEKMNKTVYKTGYGLGDTATSTISSAISRISDYVNSDIDAQPTIRPVLDLSDVTNGANSINGLFNANPSIGVLSNVSSINSMMNKRQNGNHEVISAIKDLKDSVRKSSGDTYQINGITYDDGSNVSDAIKTLIRATRVERRV